MQNIFAQATCEMLGGPSGTATCAPSTGMPSHRSCNTPWPPGNGGAWGKPPAVVMHVIAESVIDCTVHGAPPAVMDKFAAVVDKALPGQQDRLLLEAVCYQHNGSLQPDHTICH